MATAIYVGAAILVGLAMVFCYFKASCHKPERSNYKALLKLADCVISWGTNPAIAGRWRRERRPILCIHLDKFLSQPVVGEFIDDYALGLVERLRRLSVTRSPDKMVEIAIDCMEELLNQARYFHEGEKTGWRLLPEARKESDDER